MRYHLPAGVLFLSLGDCTYNPDTTTPECVTACSSSLMLYHDISTLESLCNGMAIQQSLFMCLASSCDDQYGQALAYTILACDHHGAAISNLFPVQVQHTGPLATRQSSSIAARFDTAIFGFDNHLSLSIDCEAGSDGVLTLSLPETTPYSNGQAAPGSGPPVSPESGSTDTNSGRSPLDGNPESNAGISPEDSTEPYTQQSGVSGGEGSVGSPSISDGDCSGNNPADPAPDHPGTPQECAILVDDSSCPNANQPPACTFAPNPPPAGTIPYSDGLADNNGDSPHEPPTNGIYSQLSASPTLPQSASCQPKPATSSDTNTPSSDCVTCGGALGHYPEDATANANEPVSPGQSPSPDNEDASTLPVSPDGQAPGGSQNTSENGRSVPSPCQADEESNSLASGDADTGSANNGGSDGPSDLDPHLSDHTSPPTQLPDSSQPAKSNIVGDTHTVPTQVASTKTRVVTLEQGQDQDQEISTSISSTGDQKETFPFVSSVPTTSSALADVSLEPVAPPPYTVVSSDNPEIFRVVLMRLCLFVFITTLLISAEGPVPVVAILLWLGLLLEIF